MAIVVTRSGEVVSTSSPLTQEQTNTAWEHIIRAWARKHPEALRALSPEPDPVSQPALQPQLMSGV